LLLLQTVQYNRQCRTAALGYKDTYRLGKGVDDRGSMANVEDMRDESNT